MCRSSGSKFFVLFLLSVACEGSVAPDAPHTRGQNGIENLPRKWITQLFQEAEANFRIADSASAKCKHDFETYQIHLGNQTEWAIRMLESSEWPSFGILAGTMNHMGNWFECNSVSNKDINGQYCSVSARYNLTGSFLDDLTSSKSNELESSAWTALEEFQKQRWKTDRQRTSWALCIPSSCEAADIEDSVQKTLQPIFRRQNIQISVTVSPNTCSKPLENWWKDYGTGYNLFWIFIKSILAIVVFSSVYHRSTKYKNKGKPEQKSLSFELITSFSVFRNFKELTVVSPEDIPSLYMWKIIYMCLIVFGHRIIFFYSYPFFNAESIELDLYSEGSSLIGIFYCGFIMVEIFFMFSGFVSFTAHLAKIKVKGWIAAVEDLLYRWARMIPAHMFALAILIYVLPSLSDGPMWYRTVIEAERCKLSLWSNFFAVSNIFGTEKMCLFHSWYPSVDIQLTIFGSVILMVYAINERLGTYLTLLVFSAGTVYSFILTYVNKYHGVLPVFPSSMYTDRNSDEFLNSYISTMTRVASYLVGFIFGIVTKRLAEIKFKFTEENVFILVILLLCSKVAIINYIPELSEFTKPYNRLENAVSAAIIRSLFVLPEAILCCAYGSARKCRYLRLADSPMWVPLGRLLYGIFVISVIFQFYHSASHQVLIPSYSLAYIFWLFIGDIIYSAIGSLFLYLTIQGPMFNLLKMVIRQSSRRVFAALIAHKIQTNGITLPGNEATHNKKL